MSARQSVSIMTDEWANTLGWSKTFIGSGQSVALVMVAIFAPVAGNLADRFGARIMLVAGLLLLMAGLLAFAAVPVAGIYILGYGLVGGVGFATANIHLISTALAKIFTENRGLATGIANSGATAGQFITVPLLTIGLSYFSWRWSIVGARRRLCRHGRGHLDRAEAVAGGGRGKGGNHLEGAPVGPAQIPPHQSHLSHSLLELLHLRHHHDRAPSKPTSCPMPPICGFPPVPASGIYGLTMAINFAGMMLSGWLTDRVNRPAAAGLHLHHALALLHRADVCGHQL